MLRKPTSKSIITPILLSAISVDEGRLNTA
jgi:hypothetical protein